MNQDKQGALIGCGFFARNHMNAWANLPGARIVAVCDTDHARAVAMSAEFGGPRVYTDAAEMFVAEDLDFVDVATQSDSHRALVELAVGHARTVICQKPFADTAEDAAAMVSSAEAAQAALIVHENFRWHRSFIVMKEMIEAGRIGTPHTGRFSFRHGYDNYVNQPYLAEVARFAIMDVGLHLFDLARHFMGDVSRISCTTQRLNPIVKGEDAFTALLAHEAGGSSVVDCSFFSRYRPEPFPNTAAVIEGETGTLELDRWNRLTVHSDTGAEVMDVEAEVPSWGARPWHCVQDSVQRFQAHAIEVMNGRAAPQPSGAHNLDTVKLALAAYESAETGTTVSL